MLVDIHAHLEDSSFDNDLDEVIERAKKANVRCIINSGTNQKRNERSLELSKRYDIVRASLGLYPTEVIKNSEEELQKQIEFIEKNKNKIVAIGEIGLDYYEIKNSKSINKIKDQQKKLFEKLISLAEKTNLPVIIHSRKAEQDVLDILESSNLRRVIMHCFSGNMKLVKRIEENGYFASIPPIIAFSTHFQKVVETLPSTQLLTETDAPYLSPVKGERNEPSNIAYTIDSISQIKKVTKEEVEKIIFMNFQKLFLK